MGLKPDRHPGVLLLAGGIVAAAIVGIVGALLMTSGDRARTVERYLAQAQAVLDAESGLAIAITDARRIWRDPDPAGRIEALGELVVPGPFRAGRAPWSVRVNRVDVVEEGAAEVEFISHGSHRGASHTMVSVLRIEVRSGVSKGGR